MKIHDPGKYNDACTAARALTGGSVVLIVLNGKKGAGFAMQAESPVIIDGLPALLRRLADNIEVMHEGSN